MPHFDSPASMSLLEESPMALSFDRKAFIDIVTEGKGDIGGVMPTATRGALGHAARDPENPAGL
jgi:hypothetical protein